MISSKNFATRVVFLCALIAIPSIKNSFADDEAPSADKQERIEVTGSHIKRIDTEGVSTVQTVTKADIEKKGYDNLGDVVRDLGVNSFGGDNTMSGNSGVPGNADVSLRGLGADNTLVLLNGQRLPQDAITGTVDINLIPMAAIERIEILKDGASAIYGSDALGGVVNIITRKDFKGTQLNVTETLPTNYGDGKRTIVSVVNGFNSEKLNVVTSLAYTYDQAIYSRKRPWSNLDGKDHFSSSGNPGSFKDTTAGATKYSASTNCPANRTFTDSAGNTRCYFKFSDYAEEMPKINQIGGLSEVHYDLNSDVKLNARLNIIHRKATEQAAPSPDTLSGITNSNWAADSGLSGVSNGDSLNINLRTEALGPRINEVTTNSYGGLLGATIQLPKDWQLDVNATYTLVHNSLSGTSGFGLEDKLGALISDGTYNPFGANGNQGSAAGASYVPFENSGTMLSTVEASASGVIGHNWAGDISLAFGTLVNYSRYMDQADDQTINGNVMGNAGGSGAGHRLAEAVYSEFSIPLVEKKLEMQLAARYDHYSDFGNTVNPKIGLLYHATPSLLFRATAGTGFRAPLLTELYAGQSSGYQSFIDQVACNKLGGDYCQAKQYLVTGGSNPKLKEETSKSLTFGAIWEPNHDFNIATDWFFTKIDNMPGINLHDMTVAEAQGIDVTASGVTVPRNADGSLNEDDANGIKAPLLNLLGIKEFGVDVTPSYTWGKFKFSTEQNQIFFYDTSGFPGLTAVDKIGTYGLPKWRNSTSVSYFPSAPHAISLTARTIPHQLTADTSSVTNGKETYISRITTFDLSWVYKTKKDGDFTLSVINVMNTLPPYDNSSPTSMVNYGLYDPNGRQVVLAYKRNL